MAVLISRTADTDDDLTGTFGTVHNNAWKQEIYDQIDAALAQVLSLADGGTVTGIVEVSGATGGFRLVSRDGSGATWLIYNPTGDALEFFNTTASDIVMSLSNAGALTLDSGITATGLIETNGASGGFRLQPRDASGATWLILNPTGDGLEFFNTVLSGNAATLTNAGLLTTAGALSIGASGGNVVWGTYTPTLTNGTNVGASTAAVCLYTRVGSNVIVHGTVQIDPTAAGGTPTVLGISLPVASDLAAATDLSGVFVGTGTGVGETGSVSGDAANNRATVTFDANTTSNVFYYFTFQYQIL